MRVERVGGLFSERRDILTIASRDNTNLIVGIGRQMAAVDSGEQIETLRHPPRHHTRAA
ncbi:MAG: hypothetical protein WAU75_02000 [Solirubrobacteraceae bacterium]